MVKHSELQKGKSSATRNVGMSVCLYDCTLKFKTKSDGLLCSNDFKECWLLHSTQTLIKGLKYCVNLSAKI